MRIIDAYIVRQFVQTFLVCFVSLTGLYIVIDAFGHVDELLAYADRHGGLLSVVSSHYSYQSLLFFDKMSGVLALISAMFTVTWIERHHEMTALLAAGIPKMRVVLPVVVCAIGISLAAAANREITIPRVRHHLIAGTRALSNKSAHPVHPRHDRQTGVFLNGREAFFEEKRIHSPDFLLPSGLNHYGKRLLGTDAFYLTATPDHPNGYLITGVSQPRQIASRRSLALDKQTVLFTPLKSPWLEDDQCFVASDVYFDMLEGGSLWQQYASTPELIEGLASPSLDFGAPIRFEVHARLVRPFLDTTLLFLGLPLVLTKRNRNAFVAVGLCLAVVTVFMLGALVCQFLGASGLVRPPALAAWLPLALFVPAAVYLADPLRE